MTEKTVAGVKQTFSYSPNNRLAKVTDGAGATIAGYYYDPYGRRLWKEIAGVRTYFHYTDEGLAGEYAADGHELRTYGYQPGSAWGTNPLFVQEHGRYSWYLNDHLGTPQKLIAENGAVVWEVVYDAFGKADVLTETVVNNLRFAGQYFDAETGLHYNWHRFYDPETGRYVSADPIGLDGGMNLYSYVSNNPVNAVDPIGLYERLSFNKVQDLVNKNNRSSMSNEFIICLIWYESGFYPDMPHYKGMANGLMAIIKSQAFTQANTVIKARNRKNKGNTPEFKWKDILDPATNIQVGTTYIDWIQKNYQKTFDETFKSMYGTGSDYPLNSIYECEKCLKERKCENDDPKACLEKARK